MIKVNRIQEVETYNQKIDIKFLQYLLTKKPFTQSDIGDLRKDEFEELVSAYSIFKESPISKETIQTIYQFLAKKDIEITDDLMMSISSIYGKENIIHENIELFIRILESQCLLDKTYEMAQLIFNKILIDHSYCPIIFYPDKVTTILLASQNNQSIETIDNLFYKLFISTYQHYNIPRDMKSREEIFNLILDHEVMLRELYGINSLGLFGSYARDEQHEYSDIDIWIKCSTQLDKTELFNIRSLLRTLLNLYVDLNLWQESLSETMFIDSITIF